MKWKVQEGEKGTNSVPPDIRPGPVPRYLSDGLVTSTDFITLTYCSSLSFADFVPRF